MKIQKYISIQVFKYSSIQVFKYSSIQVSKFKSLQFNKMILPTINNVKVLSDLIITIFSPAGRQPARVPAPVHVRHVAAEGSLHAPRLGRQQPGPQPLPVTPGTRATWPRVH